MSQPAKYQLAEAPGILAISGVLTFATAASALETGRAALGRGSGRGALSGGGMARDDAHRERERESENAQHG